MIECQREGKLPLKIASQSGSIRNSRTFVEGLLTGVGVQLQELPRLLSEGPEAKVPEFCQEFAERIVSLSGPNRNNGTLFADIMKESTLLKNSLRDTFQPFTGRPNVGELSNGSSAHDVRS